MDLRLNDNCEVTEAMDRVLEAAIAEGVVLPAVSVHRLDGAAPYVAHSRGHEVVVESERRCEFTLRLEGSDAGETRRVTREMNVTRFDDRFDLAGCIREIGGQAAVLLAAELNGTSRH